MINDLKTADIIVKLITAIGIVLLYLLGIISGPAAVVLFTLAIVTLTIYLVRVFHTRLPFD